MIMIISSHSSIRSFFPDLDEIMLFLPGKKSLGIIDIKNNQEHADQVR